MIHTPAQEQLKQYIIEIHNVKFKLKHLRAMYKTFWQKYNVIVILCYGQKHKNVKRRTSLLTF